MNKTKTHTTKNDTVFEWIETDELVEQLKQLHQFSSKEQHPIPDIGPKNTLV
jgi:hypothetical protein